MTPDTRTRSDRTAVVSRPRRRAFVMGLGAVVLAVQAAPEVPMPPGGRRWRIGWLLFADPGSNTSRKVFDAFNGAMRDKGWIQGTHYTIDTRSSGGDARRFPALAAELVQVAPDVLMAVETTALVLRQQTTTIPIVLWQSLDPVAAGLVQSLARPGTNVTGLSNVADGLTIKNTEALLEIVPRARRIAVLYDPFWSAATHQIAVARDIARAKGAEVDAYPITADPQSLSAAWAGIDRRRPDGLVIFNNAATFAHASAIQAGVLARKVTATGMMEFGAVARHGVNTLGNAREAADFVDSIFRGAKPAELPVRQVMSVIVTIHLARARELGIELPVSLRIRADEVIE